jgi:hypothetical protein
MQVRSEGGVGVGADVDGAVVVVILGKHKPLGNGELLFRVTSDGLLFSQARAAARSLTHASSKVLCAAAMTTTRASCFLCAVAAAA